MTVQELIDALRRFPPDMLVFVVNNCADAGTSLFDPHPALRTVGRSRGIFADGPDYTMEAIGYVDDSLRRLATSADQEIVAI